MKKSNPGPESNYSELAAQLQLQRQTLEDKFKATHSISIAFLELVNEAKTFFEIVEPLRDQVSWCFMVTLLEFRVQVHYFTYLAIVS